jgi:hypothetical protein
MSSPLKVHYLRRSLRVVKGKERFITTSEDAADAQREPGMPVPDQARSSIAVTAKAKTYDEDPEQPGGEPREEPGGNQTPSTLRARKHRLISKKPASHSVSRTGRPLSGSRALAHAM